MTDPGRDGRFGTCDEQTLTVYNHNPGVVSSTKMINDDRLAARYDGLDIVANKRFSRGWTQVLAPRVVRLNITYNFGRQGPENGRTGPAVQTSGPVSRATR